MKKFMHLMGFVVAMLTANTASAQDNYVFNHLAAGVEVGTTGWGIEIAAPATPYLTVRTGFTSMPKFSYSTDINYTVGGENKNVDIKGKLNMTDWKLLADVYPSKKSSFHFTAGFYVGSSKPIEVYNTGDLDVEEGEGLEIGGVFVRPDDEGLVHLNLKTQSFKPYLGFGFGRPISSKHKVSVACDLGVQFWGKPSLKVYSPDEEQWVKIQKNDVDDEDLNDALDIIEKVVVYPVLNLRVYFNAF